MGGHARSSVRYTTPAKDSPRGALSGIPSPPASALYRTSARCGTRRDTGPRGCRTDQRLHAPWRQPVL